jgi:uncharacterized protein YfaP (DUF2135 family)
LARIGRRIIEGHLKQAGSQRTAHVLVVNGRRRRCRPATTAATRALTPAVSVNLQADQGRTAQIRGKVAAAGKSGPATVVVNGSAMPLEMGEDGRFARPYGFGSGSNSVEVRAGGVKRLMRTQFFDAYAGKTQPGLRIILSWDSAATDLDLHVVTPEGGHAWYGKPVPRDGTAIDVDVTTGFGPEIFSSTTPVKGSYQVYVNYYGSGEPSAAITVAQITIITNENTPSEKRQLLAVPMRAPGELTVIRLFVFP